VENRCPWFDSGDNLQQRVAEAEETVNMSVGLGRYCGKANDENIQNHNASPTRLYPMCPSDGYQNHGPELYGISVYFFWLVNPIMSPF